MQWYQKLFWYTGIRSQIVTKRPETQFCSKPETQETKRQNWDSRSSWITWLVKNGKLSDNAPQNFIQEWDVSDNALKKSLILSPNTNTKVAKALSVPYNSISVLKTIIINHKMLINKWCWNEIMILIMSIDDSFFLLLFTWAVTVSAPTKPANKLSLAPSRGMRKR